MSKNSKRLMLIAVISLIAGMALSRVMVGQEQELTLELPVSKLDKERSVPYAINKPEVELPSQKPIKPRQWNTRTKVWLARSCVGEAGFGLVSLEGSTHDECIAIAYVYAERARATGWKLEKVIRKYSAAVKRHSLHTRPWLLELDADLKKPKSWPDTIKWSVYKELWKKRLTLLDDWASGKLPNPIPGANHYGGGMDARRAEHVYRWKRLPAPPHFRNRFYTSLIKENPRKYRPKNKHHGRKGIIYGNY